MGFENSTIVRFRKDPDAQRKAPRWICAGLAALDALAPALAARAGEHLFLRPVRHATPPREREALRGARAFDVPFRGGRLRAWRFGEGPLVLLAHGWSGRGSQLAGFAPALVDAGLGVVTFDAPAHGRSSGWTATVPLLAEAVRAVSCHVGGVRAAVAHSLGAPAVTLAMLRGLRLDAAVFVGPPRGPVEAFRMFSEALGLSERARAGTRARLEARLALRFEDFDLPRLTGRLTTPLLVIHDRDDAEVAWSEGAAVAAGWPGATLWSTEGLGHHRILRAPEVLARTAAFVSGQVHAARCGCGRPARPGRRACASCALSEALFERSTRWIQSVA